MTIFLAGKSSQSPVCGVAIAKIRSEGEAEAGGGGARSADGGPGEEAGEVEDVDAICKIRGFDLKIQCAAFLAIKFRANGSSQRKIGFHASAVEIDSREDFLAVLSQQKIQINIDGIEFDRQPTAVVRADRSPYTLCGLHANAGTHGVALVLGDGEASGVGELVACFTAEKKAAGDRSLGASGLVRIAQKAGETAPFGDGEANFFANDARIVEGDWKTDARVQQDVVIGKI